MAKIFFFQKKNSRDGSLLEDIIDCDERTAWDYYRKPRFFKYIGWVDDAEARKLKSNTKLEKDEKTGMIKQFTEEQKQQRRNLFDKLLELARNNPDKSSPRDLTKKDPWGTLSRQDLDKVTRTGGKI